MNVELRSNDILSGRGKGVASHSGNVIFREIIDRYYVEYYGTTSNNSKHNVTQKVRAEIENLRPAGRFLIKKRDNYFVLDNKGVEDKVKQALRDRIKQASRRKEVMKPKEISQDPKPNEPILRPSGNSLLDVSHINAAPIDSSWIKSDQVSSPSITFDLNAIEKHPSSGAMGSKSDMSFDSFIGKALSSLSLNTFSIEHLNVSSARLNPMSLDDLFPTIEDMNDGFDANLRNDRKMLPRQREMLLKRERERASTSTRTMNLWPSSIPIESTSSIMMPNDLDLSAYAHDIVDSNMSSFNTITSV